jgi:hypothetical protein
MATTATDSVYPNLHLADEDAGPMPEQYNGVPPDENTGAQMSNETDTTIQFSAPNRHSTNANSNSLNHEAPKKKKPKRAYKKNPNKPKRPLSAYNCFFRFERERLVRNAVLEGVEDEEEKEKLEELIVSNERTKNGNRVHRKSHGKWVGVCH